MNSTNTTTIQQLTNGGTAAALSVMTGAQIVYNDLDNSIHIHFPKLVGLAGKKFKTLSVDYNSATDLYDLRGWKFNNKTFESEQKFQIDGIGCESLRQTCETLTGLYFTF